MEINFSNKKVLQGSAFMDVSVASVVQEEDVLCVPLIDRGTVRYYHLKNIWGKRNTV